MLSTGIVSHTSDPQSTPCLSPSLAEDLQFPPDCSTSVTEVKDPECKLGPESHTESFGDR